MKNKKFSISCPNCQAKERVVKKCIDCHKYCCLECSIDGLCKECFIDTYSTKEKKLYFIDKYSIEQVNHPCI